MPAAPEPRSPPVHAEQLAEIKAAQEKRIEGDAWAWRWRGEGAGTPRSRRSERQRNALNTCQKKRHQSVTTAQKDRQRYNKDRQVIKSF